MTGGGSSYNRLDSTEVLRPGSEWQEITSARLPRPLTGVRVITVNNRVLLFGEWRQIIISRSMALYTGLFFTGERDRYFNSRGDILEYKDGDNWRKVGSMKNKRYFHAISRVNFNDFSDYCI